MTVNQEKQRERLHDAALHALANPIRRSMLHVLARGEKSALELVDTFPEEATLVSYHIRMLRHAGLVAARKLGRRQTVYRLHESMIADLASFLVGVETALQTSRERASSSVSEGLLDAAVDKLNVGVWIINPELETSYVNPRTLQLLGLEERELKGRALSSLVIEPRFPTFLSYLGSGTHSDIDIRVGVSAASSVALRASFSPIISPQGASFGTMIVLREDNW